MNEDGTLRISESDLNDFEIIEVKSDQPEEQEGDWETVSEEEAEEF